jgi:hypothetical protein
MHIERLRNDLFVNLSSHFNINNLLCGDSNLPGCENESNFLVIQDFIIKSKFIVLFKNNFMELTETLLLIFAGSSFQSQTVEGKKLLL